MGCSVFQWLLLTIGLCAGAAWKALDPEEVFFGFSRCGEDFTPNDSNRESRIRNWAKWNLSPVDNWTMCYVKCCLEKLELLDPVSHKFMPGRVRIQYLEYKKYTNFSEEKINNFKNALETANDKMLDHSPCRNVFEILTKHLASHLRTIQVVYHGDPTLTSKIYNDKGKNIRQKKQAYTEHCGSKFYDKGSSALCEFRSKGTIGSDKNFPKLMDCIFKGFRYLTKDRKIDPSEIIRDIHAIGEHNHDNRVRSLISGCKIITGSEALGYYQCLVNNYEIGAVFREAYNYREARSADYDYAFIIPGPPEYNYPEVMRNLSVIDARQCPGIATRVAVNPRGDSK